MSKQTDADARKSLNFLDEIGCLRDSEVNISFVKRNMLSLAEIHKMLLGSKIKNQIKTPKEFMDMVSCLKEVKKKLARKLGDAIVLAEDHILSGNVEVGVAILDDFIKECPCEFYRENALGFKKTFIKDYKSPKKDKLKWKKKLIAVMSIDSGKRMLKGLEEIIENCPVVTVRQTAKKIKKDIESKKIVLS